MTKEQMVAGMIRGRRLMVDRRDAPELPELLALVEEGFVEFEFVIFDEQSTALRFKWKSRSHTT